MKHLRGFMFMAIGIALISSISGIGSSPWVRLVFVISMPLAVFLLALYVLEDPQLDEVKIWKK